MNATDLTFDLGNVLTIIGGIIAVVTVWIRFNVKMEIIKQKVEQNDINISDNYRKCVIMKEDYNKLLDKSNEFLHDRIDKISDEVKDNRIKADQSVNELKSAMQEMELRIIKAIHEISNYNKN
jgi:ElaB/YqjD/DUF883 family membrane-anchored ribosome-binding protein